MCGRFTQRFPWQELVQLYRLTQTPPNLRPNYNVCPTDPISVIIPGDNGLFLMPMRWQLIPRWWKKSLKELPATFNAKAETVAEKPMFRSAFKRNRGNSGLKLLKPAAEDVLQRRPVSKQVNSSRAPDDDPTLIDKVTI